MRLKRLETYGFKSFADRLTFDFESGITAVIGPNGCGKSNVVDSIKWVVGEQSAKALRGASMDDVIFNGCATRRPMPLAEATLVLEKDAGDGQAVEMAITRRLTRDGQSSYYIDGRPARLKDIRELLLGTGIGNSAYSVIEQGRIGFILEASVKDRRGIIEEAAGISRYKVRRKAAQRRLERVDLDLERIRQVHAEVEKRTKVVRRQAETALRWQELSGKLRGMRLIFAHEEYGRLSGEERNLVQRIAGLQDDAARVAARLGELDAALAGADAELAGLDEGIARLESARSESRAARDVAASQARDSRHRLVELAQQEADDRQAITQIDAKRDQVESDAARTEASLQLADTAGDDELGRLYRERRGALDQLLTAIDALIREVERAKGRELDCLRELAACDARLGSLAAAAKGVTEREQRLVGRNQGQVEQIQALVAAEAAAAALVAQGGVQLAAGHDKLDAMIRDRETAQAETGRLETALNDLRHEEGRAEVRLRLLSEYENKLEGVFGGVKDVLKQMDRLHGICGIVADLFQVDKEYELAIETALGGRAQNIITETQEAAKAAIDFLKRERRGRATFLPLDDIQGRDGDHRALMKEPGVLGLGSELIRFDKRYKSAFSNLLGGTLICESLDHAIAIRRRHRTNLQLVTLDGDLINAGGAMTGGRQQGKDAGGLVSRKNEIRRLDEQLGELRAKKVETSTAVEGNRRKAFDLAMQVEEQRRANQAAERALGEAKAQAMKAERDRVHVQESVATADVEGAELRREQDQLAADRVALDARRGELEAARQVVEGELAVLHDRLQKHGAERDRIQEEVSTLRVDLATSEERREALKNHLGHVRRQLAELADTRQERERRIEAAQRRREDLTALGARSETEHAAQAARFDALSAEHAAQVQRRDALRSGQEGERQEQRALQTRRGSLERELGEANGKAGEVRVRLEGLCQRLRDDHQIDLAAEHAAYQRPANLDLPALRRDLSSTEAELARLGPVNLAAIDELKEVEAREGFLGKHLADLSETRVKLQDIIDELNRTCRKEFQKTFSVVRKNFQDLFRKLYGGGKADLVLEFDPEDKEKDVLEAGLEIVAQPPGKQPKSITLLSGGEKALTAIALLFAVYRTKPSPFCILDEVDAPLDESNTDVYCHMLKEFCDSSQFIVITHNKRTMQYADCLYGITQQEAGVSTKISVKLEDVSSDGELVTSVRGSGPFAG